MTNTGTFAEIEETFKQGYLVQCTDPKGRVKQYQYDPSIKLAFDPIRNRWETFIPFEELLEGEWKTI